MQKPRFQKWLPALFCGAVCYILFSAPELCARGVREALAICGNTVIPSLFPFMVVSGFLVHSGTSAALGRIAAPITARLFRLPGVSAGVILMSLVGGFPVGVKMTAQLLDAGQLNESQAKRMCLFCVNAGPCFRDFRCRHNGTRQYACGCFAVCRFVPWCPVARHMHAIFCKERTEHFKKGTNAPSDKSCRRAV